MADPRIARLAHVMVNYSLALKPGQQMWLRTTPLAQELNLAVYEEAVRAGAYVFVQQSIPGAEELLYKYGSDKLLDFIAPVRKLIVDTFDASLLIFADDNTRALAGVDPKRIARARKAGARLDFGPWEQVFYGEFDGRRRKRVLIKIIGE